MAEIIFMKALKLFIAWTCYLGTGVIFIDQIMGANLDKLAHIPDPAKEIILWLLIVFWCIKIVWFILDKGQELRERNQKMEIEKGEHSPNPMPYKPKITKKNKKAL